jgi:hypothetical protein
MRTHRQAVVFRALLPLEGHRQRIEERIEGLSVLVRPSEAALADFRAAFWRYLNESMTVKLWRLQCGGPTMALNFPNPSRSYDATLRAVRFWGHDGAMEASFFVNQDALQRIQPGMRFDERGLLGAFDCHRDLIHATAAKVYRRGRKALYELISDDF